MKIFDNFSQCFKNIKEIINFFLSVDLHSLLYTKLTAIWTWCILHQGHLFHVDIFFFILNLRSRFPKMHRRERKEIGYGVAKRNEHSSGTTETNE